LFRGGRNFDEAARFAEDGVEDSLMNWVGLVAVLAVGIIPIVVMQRNRTKPLKKRREVDFCWFGTTKGVAKAHVWCVCLGSGGAGPTKPSKK
jgi:hypothetical protein